MPMSLESALLYLELPSCVVDSEVVQPLLHATKQYLATRYRNINRSEEELMSLPLAAIEVVLGSDGLEVLSEDDVFNLVLNWARKHYPKIEERRDVLSNRLSRLVCFRNLGSRKLKRVLDYPDLDHKQVSKLVFDALCFKAEGRTVHTSRDPLIANRGRVYTYYPIKVVKLGLYRPSCIIFFELKKQDCADLFKSRRIVSDTICLGGQRFSLHPQCLKHPQSLSAHYFGLYLVAHKGSRSFRCDYEVEVMKKPLKVFESKHKFKAPTCDPSAVATVLGFNMFGIEWKDFMADESEYFIDGILHLRVNMTINSCRT